MRIKFKLLRSFSSDVRGATMMVVGLSIMAIMMSVGVAVDMGRAQMARARLSSALDSAGLAAAATVNTADPQTEAAKFFNANFTSNNPNSGIVVTQITATPDLSNTVITLTARANVPTTFMRIFGYENMPIQADAEITRENLGMELVLVLDTTGSMAGTKIQSLRSSAQDLMNILYGNRTQIDNLWVALIPYVASANIGNTRMSWLRTNTTTSLNALYPSNFPNNQTRWRGCVEERAVVTSGGVTYNYDIDDTPPSSTNINTRWPVYLWPDTAADNDWINNNGSISITSSKGPNIECAQTMIPLRATKTTITNGISALAVASKGGTMSNTGLAWAYRMLSPRWRGMWDHDQVNGQTLLPLDYNTPLMKKVVVIMTDGENQFYDSTSADPPYSDYTAYRRLGTDRTDINTTNQNTARVKINTKTANLCTAMKANGIVIYTVTFQLGSGSTQNEARTLFRNCATKPEYYFDADTSADLSTAFRAIGDALANLRITH